MILQIHELARADLFQAEYFYDAQSPGLGSHFSRCLEEDIERVLELHSQPDFSYSPQKLGKYLMARSKNFPWTIYYRKDDHSLVVLAILDQRFSPSRIKEILTSRNSS